jgi:hypothetical protein
MPSTLFEKKIKPDDSAGKFFCLAVLFVVFIIYVTSCTTTNQFNNSSSPLEIKTGDNVRSSPGSYDDTGLPVYESCPVSPDSFSTLPRYNTGHYHLAVLACV